MKAIRIYTVTCAELENTLFELKNVISIVRVSPFIHEPVNDVYKADYLIVTSEEK